MELSIVSDEYLHLQIAEHNRLLENAGDDPILAPQHVSWIKYYQDELDNRKKPFNIAVISINQWTTQPNVAMDILAPYGSHLCENGGKWRPYAEVFCSMCPPKKEPPKV